MLADEVHNGLCDQGRVLQRHRMADPGEADTLSSLQAFSQRAVARTVRAVEHLTLSPVDEKNGLLDRLDPGGVGVPADQGMNLLVEEVATAPHGILESCLAEGPNEDLTITRTAHTPDEVVEVLAASIARRSALLFDSS